MRRRRRLQVLGLRAYPPDAPSMEEECTVRPQPNHTCTVIRGELRIRASGNATGALEEQVLETMERGMAQNGTYRGVDDRIVRLTFNASAVPPPTPAPTPPPSPPPLSRSREIPAYPFVILIFAVLVPLVGLVWYRNRQFGGGEYYDEEYYEEGEYGEDYGDEGYGDEGYHDEGYHDEAYHGEGYGEGYGEDGGYANDDGGYGDDAYSAYRYGSKRSSRGGSGGGGGGGDGGDDGGDDGVERGGGPAAGAGHQQGMYGAVGGAADAVGGAMGWAVGAVGGAVDAVRPSLLGPLGLGPRDGAHGGDQRRPPQTLGDSGNASSSFVTIRQGTESDWGDAYGVEQDDEPFSDGFSSLGGGRGR